MKPAARLRFDQLRTPRKHGETLVTPPAARWPEVIQHNRMLRRGYDFQIGGRHCRDVYAASPDAPRLLTGHQPEFFHPGVWAKNVLAAHTAGRLSGEAVFLVVDNDATHQLALCWPEQHENGLRIGELALDPAPAGCTFEQWPTRTSSEWRSLWQGLPESVIREHDRPLRHFLESMIDPGGGPPPDARASDYVRRWSAGIGALDRALGVAAPAIARVGALADAAGVSSVSWGAFVTHLLVNAASFAAAYNAALRTYRDQKGIRGTHRPIPDLVMRDGRTEAPLWASRPGETRRRVFVETAIGDRTKIFAGDQPIGEFGADQSLPTDGALGSWNLRPRALTLTLYARMFLSDLFIHGLGGATYDEITDGVIRRFFGVEPPEYACVTATLRLPIKTYDVRPTHLASVQRRLRDARYNPRRLVHWSSSRGSSAAATGVEPDAWRSL
ncbi:MAG: hypothetical protein V3T70_08565, partial [Phycisphaerae bacterium]